MKKEIVTKRNGKWEDIKNDNEIKRGKRIIQHERRRHGRKRKIDLAQNAGEKKQELGKEKENVKGSGRREREAGKEESGEGKREKKIKRGKGDEGRK